MLAASLLLTPVAIACVSLGQSTPLLLVAVLLAPSMVTSPRVELALGALLAVVVSLKLFPIALVALLLWRRSWRVIWSAVGSLAVLSLIAVAVQPTLVSDFLGGLRAHEQLVSTSPWNGSIEVVLWTLGLPQGAAWVLRLLALPGLVALVARQPDDDRRWATAWLALVVVSPQLWYHYLLISVGGVAVIVARRGTVAVLLCVAAGAAALNTLGGLYWVVDQRLPSAALLVAISALVVAERRTTPHAAAPAEALAAPVG